MTRLTEYGIYALALAVYTLAAVVVGAILFGLGWALIYHPAWFGVAVFVMVIVVFALWVFVDAALLTRFHEPQHEQPPHCRDKDKQRPD